MRRVERVEMLRSEEFLRSPCDVRQARGRFTVPAQGRFCAGDPHRAAQRDVGIFAGGSDQAVVGVAQQFERVLMPAARMQQVAQFALCRECLRRVPAALEHLKIERAVEVALRVIVQPEAHVGASDRPAQGRLHARGVGEAALDPLRSHVQHVADADVDPGVVRGDGRQQVPVKELIDGLGDPLLGLGLALGRGDTHQGDAGKDHRADQQREGATPDRERQAMWGNSAFWASDEVHYDCGDASSVTFSNVAGGHLGTGNISDDPRFVNAAAGDYRLS
jgi:hypothetical protein